MATTCAAASRRSPRSAKQLAGLPLGAALQKAGMALVMKVGGASGPLYGSLLMAMGKAAGEMPADASGIAAIWAEGIEALKRRGKSEAGEKTMLDVLVPAQGRSAPPRPKASRPKRPSIGCARPPTDGLAATEPMQATKGRRPISASARSAISTRARSRARC